MTVPHPLAPYVASVAAYDIDRGSGGVHRGLPGTGLVFEIARDEPLDVAWSDIDGTRRRVWSCLSGLHTRPSLVRHTGRQSGVSVHLTVAGARALLGMPASELSGELVTLEEVAPDLAHLPEAVAEAPTDGARTVTRALEAALDRRDGDGSLGGRAAVGRALSRLTVGARVHDVADEVGWSRRRLQDVVRVETGLTPSELRRVARLARSRHDLTRAARRADVVLAEVAVRSGFADQAHMTREWRALGGCTPAAWLREEFPFVQDVPDGAAPDWR